MDLLDKVVKQIKEKDMIRDGERLIAAVSGGADSSCLLHILSRIRRNNIIRFDLICVHVHHGIRGRSADDDSKYVERLCTELDIEYRIKYVDAAGFAQNEHLSLEDAARRLRYRALEEESDGNTKIAIAHNMDDNAETLLMNLFRGSGVRGLKGISRIRSDIIRPMLTIPRKDIEQYLNERGIEWRTDETNADTAYTRNALRNELIPYVKKNINRRAAEHMADCAMDMARMQKYLNVQINKSYLKCLVAETGKIDIDILNCEDEYLRTEIIRRLYAEYNKNKDESAVDLSRRHVEAIIDMCKTTAGVSYVELKGDIRAQREYNKLYFTGKSRSGGDETLIIFDISRVGYKKEIFKASKSDSVILEAVLKKPDGEKLNPLIYETKDTLQREYINILDFDKVIKCMDSEKCDFVFRHAMHGDLIRIGGGRHKPLKKYMTDVKIPAYIRGTMLVMCLKNRILWIPGFYTEPGLLAYKGTETMLRLSLQNKEQRPQYPPA